MRRIRIPLALDLFLLRLARLRKAKGGLVFIGMALFFVFMTFEHINRTFPRYEELQQVTGYFSRCWEFSRGGKTPSRFLAVQLNEDNAFFTLQSLRRQYSFEVICKELKSHQEIPVKIFFEPSNYEHAWNAFVISSKEDGFIWALQQGDAALVKYEQELLIRKADTKNIVAFLGIFSALMIGLSIWGIKDVMYPKKRKKQSRTRKSDSHKNSIDK